jgi:YVTN family beta-propeller protein
MKATHPIFLFVPTSTTTVFRALAVLAGCLTLVADAVAYSNPIAISHDDLLIWAVNPRDDTVSVIRADTNEVLAEIAVGDQPQALAITPDKQWVYVANAGDNSVTVIRILVGEFAGFNAAVDRTVGQNGHLTTGAEPFAVTVSPDGKRVFVSNGHQDTITVINAETRTIIGHVDLRNSVANDPDRRRHFQPVSMAVTADNKRVYVTRFISFTKAGGRQGDDNGKEGLVAVLDIDTASTTLADYKVVRTVTLAPQVTGFAVPGVTDPAQAETRAFPNQLNFIALRGDHAYLPNIAASPSGPLRFNLDTHAFVNVIGGVNSDSPSDLGALNLHLGARDPEPGKRKLFFANPWSIAFTTQTGEGFGYVVSAGSDLLVKVKVGADGRLSFTEDENTTRYIDLNDPENPATSGRNAGKNPQGIVINHTGTRAYVNNFGSKNVSVVDLTTDQVIAAVPLRPLPAPGSKEEKILVGAEVFFSSRGNFDSVAGATVSFRDRLSSEGWQSCASCHPYGLTDGVVWQFAAGPRKSVQMNATFNPHFPDRQRVLNYSAIFDEVEDFELNIRNVSGPGNLPNTNPPQLDPNHGLLIGDEGNVNNAPGAINGFAIPNANRPQHTISLPGSTEKVPALTGLREWFRYAIRTPSGPLPGYGGAGATQSQIAEGRRLFEQVGCVTCHGGSHWTIAVKDFTSPPAATEIFTERTPSPTTGNPVGVQYLNRFLRDAATFNLGVPGGGNEFGRNIGAEEKAAPSVANGVIAPAQDALGQDYNGDGAGTGFSVPSLLGIFAMQPYNHNGAAESVAEILDDPRHWQHGGGDTSVLGDPAKRAALVAFIESIDLSTAPFRERLPRATTSSPIAVSADDKRVWVVNPSDDSVSVIRADNNTVLAKITVGDEPESLALTPDDQYAYVANAAGNSVSVIRVTDPAPGTFAASVISILTTGAEPWNIVCSPDGQRVFVANAIQDTITVINTADQSIVGHVDLRNTPGANASFHRHFQPRGLAVTADNSKLYVTRFLSLTKPGGRQGDDLGKEGMVAVLDINTASTAIGDYKPARVVPLAPQITGFRFPGLTADTAAFPNQLQSIVIRGDRAYLPNIAASPSGPLRFNLDTHAFVNQIGDVHSTGPTDLGALNLHLGARDPEPGKRKLFFANPWAIAFTTQSGAGSAYAVSAGSDLLVKLNVSASGELSFTGDADTTRYIDLNNPDDPMTSGRAAGKNPQGLAITGDGTRAYVANFVSLNVSVVDLTTDTVIGSVPTVDLPTPGTKAEEVLVGAEVFFSSRGNFDPVPGASVSFRDRLSSEGWQSCASCHFKALTDGVIWQFAAGPRKSVSLNSSFNPHNRDQQRLLNFSAIFDEIEDFELNVRNVSGPGNLATPINGNPLDPNHGLLIGDNGDPNVAPGAVNAFAKPNAERPQVTVTLPGSDRKIPALTAMREWVRFAVRTPNAKLPGLPGAHPPDFIAEGRTLFVTAGCANCHGGQNWTISMKDFTSPPAGSELNTERTPPQVTGNPVGAQYLNRFLRDIGSFNLGVPGQGSPFGGNIGADEKAAPAVSGGVVQPAQDALGIDYNGDGKGTGFNVPSLLGAFATPPYYHNGAAESLLDVVSDVNHRTANGRLPDRLSDPLDQLKVFAFIDSIDSATPPVFDVGPRPTYSSPIAVNATDRLIWVVNPSDDSVSVLRPDNNTRITNISVGDEPQSLAVTPDNQFVYVANAAGNSVSVIRIGDPAWGSFNASVVATITTGAEPWNVVCSPDGKRVFVANSGQDTITVINAPLQSVIGHVDLRHSLANDPDRSRHFQPRGLAVTADNSKLYVTRFLSFTKPGGRQADDFGKEGLVAVLDLDTDSTSIADYRVARALPLAPQVTGFRFPGLTDDTGAFPNQLQSVVIRGETAYLPNIAASPSGPLRFNLDTHAFVNMVAGVNSTTPVDRGALNLHLGARDPEPGKRKLFFANPWAIAFTSQVGDGFGYAVSAASDLLVKVRVLADGRLDFTVDGDTTRYIDLNDPDHPATSGANAGKNPQGIAITSDGARAYVANFVSRNVSVVDLTTDTVIAVVPTSALPAPASPGETRLVGAEMFFSSRGNFDPIPGSTGSLRDRLSSEGWQACSSCHFKGLTDGVIWQFAAGPRKSVPLNASFSPHNPNQQRLLNYSAIFDEIEDFELNIRNVSGPGNLATPINGNSLDPNHGLLIGDNGDLAVAPTVINAFGKANADRPQVTVTLPGSSTKVPALTALREWVRFAVRTPNSPVPGLPNAPSAADLAQGRKLFLEAGCATCHGGDNWTVSIKDFTAPPAPAELFTERTPPQTFGNPVGVQYLNRFLRDIGSFNLGVPGKGNEFGLNIGGPETGPPTVSSGTLVPGQDALGIDYNADGKGIGFNVPSLLGLHAAPPFLHNGAAESLAAVLSDVKHRTANGTMPDRLANPADQALVAAFVESIDFGTKILPIAAGAIQFTDLTRTGDQIELEWEGGEGPFALQKKQELREAYFATVKTTTDRRASDVFSGNAAFYRVFDLAGAPDAWFTTWLSGAAERPNPVDTAASGSADVVLDGDTLTFKIGYKGLSGPATAAHIHGPAASGETADPFIDLAPFKGAGFGTSNDLIGSVPVTPQQKAWLLSNRAYLNIHTAANPAGEIRGQIAAVVMKVSLTGSGERPTPVATPGIGFGVLTLVGHELAFHLTYQGLPGPATLAHIHGPATDARTAPPLIDLAPFNGGAFGTSGSLIGSLTVNNEQLSAIVDGLAYVNVHTGANPGGEIRGQIAVHNTATPLSADLSGAAERPDPVDTPASGFASLGLNGTALQLHVVYRGLSGPATLAHLHGPAPASGAAGVLIDLAPLHHGPFGAEGEFSGRLELTEEQRLAVLSGDTYINIHTAKNPGGEIRGQISPVVHGSLLNGANERPNPVTTDAGGFAKAALLGRHLSLGVRYSGLSDAATAAHIHGPATPDQTAPPLINLQPFAIGGFGREGVINGSQVLTASQLQHLIDGLTYFNLHTLANVAGEIRGQITAAPSLGLRPTDPAGVMDAYTAAINAGDVATALSFVADDAVYDRPPPLGQLVGKDAIRGFVESLVARKARIALVGLRRVEGEKVTWSSRVTLLNANDPSGPPDVVENNSESIVRGGKIVQHTARPRQ